MAADVQQVQVTYRADAAALFPLALGTGLLSIISLGIYRFWAKARIRRFVWGNIRLDDDALEFTGTGLEMFLGFLIVKMYEKTTPNRSNPLYSRVFLVLPTNLRDRR